jgi:hypothetical protein
LPVECYTNNLTAARYGYLVGERAKSIEKTNRLLVIQDEIYKKKYKNDIFGAIKFVINAFAKEVGCNISYKSFEWDEFKKSTQLRDTALPSINIELESDMPIDNEKLWKGIYCSNAFFQDNVYNEGITNGWIWYTLDGKHEYAITRIIKVDVI